MDTKRFTLNQLIDVALCTPEAGVVNFKILRIVLKIIAKELNLEDVIARVLLKDLQQTATLMTCKEKKVKDVPEDSNELKVAKEENENHSSSTISEDKKEDHDSVQSSKELKEIIKTDTRTDVETAFGDADHESSTHHSKSDSVLEESIETNKLNESIAKLESIVHESLNEEVITEDESDLLYQRQQERRISEEKSSSYADAEKDSFSIESMHRPTFKMRSDASDSSDAQCSGNKWLVSNMWKTMNFSKRIDAMELGMDKIVNVLSTHSRTIDNQRKDFEAQKIIEKHALKMIEEGINNLVESANETDAKLESVLMREEHFDFKNEVDSKLFDMKEKMEELNEVYTKLDKSVNNLFTEIKKNDEKIKYLENNTGLYCDAEEESVVDFPALREMFQNFVNQMEPIIEKFQRELELESEQDISMSEQLMTLRINVRNLIDDAKNMKNKFENLQEDYFRQKETIGILVEANEKGFTSEDKDDFYDMQKRIRELEIDCRQLSMLNDLNNAVTTLKAIKANKSEVEAALSQKAECRDIERKVNREEYEKITIEHSYKLQNVETDIEILKENLERDVRKISEEMDNKVQRYDIENLSESVHYRLKNLNLKLKQLQHIVEIESEMPAGTGTKVKCISCEVSAKRLHNTIVKSFPQTIVSKSQGTVNPKQIVSFNKKDILPSNECDHTGRDIGGYTSVQSEKAKRTFPVIGFKNKWENVLIEGTDNSVYQGQFKKSPNKNK